MRPAVLPQLDALFLHMEGAPGPSRLVDISPAAACGAPAVSQQGDGSGYERRTLVAPQALCELAAAGASFHFSRLGNIRVWLHGKVHAAATQADCGLDAGRALTAEETEYLNAYLLHLGRSWNDVDQPRHREDPA